MKFAAIYGIGMAMGFTPDQVDGMSLWQFRAGVAGWLASKGVKMRQPSDDASLDEAAALLDAALAAGKV